MQDGDLFSSKDGSVIGDGMLYSGAGKITLVSTGVKLNIRKP
jgi:hypothetical protein